MESTARASAKVEPMAERADPAAVAWAATQSLSRTSARHRLKPLVSYVATQRGMRGAVTATAEHKPATKRKRTRFQAESEGRIPPLPLSFREATDRVCESRDQVTIWWEEFAP